MPLDRPDLCVCTRLENFIECTNFLFVIGLTWPMRIDTIDVTTSCFWVEREWCFLKLVCDCDTCTHCIHTHHVPTPARKNKMPDVKKVASRRRSTPRGNGCFPLNTTQANRVFPTRHEGGGILGRHAVTNRSNVLWPLTSMSHIWCWQHAALTIMVSVLAQLLEKHLAIVGETISIT